MDCVVRPPRAPILPVRDSCLSEPLRCGKLRGHGDLAGTKAGPLHLEHGLASRDTFSRRWPLLDPSRFLACLRGFPALQIIFHRFSRLRISPECDGRHSFFGALT
jgi:hypothetical protein